jgi:hypothetical protein
VTRTAPLLATCLAAVLAPATVDAAAAQHPPSSIFEDFYDVPAGAHAVTLCWGGDGTYDVDSYTIQRAKGVRPPRRNSPPIATLKGSRGKPPETCYESDGLKTDRAYTFRVVGHNEAGAGEAGIHTAAARVEGSYVLVPGATTVLVGSGENSYPQIAFSPGHGLHAVFDKFVAGTSRTGLYHSARGTGGWSKPGLLSSEFQDRHPHIAANARGDVVVGWNNYAEGPAYRFKPAGTNQFGPRTTFLDQPSDTLEALVLDRAGHIHALIDRYGYGIWSGRGLHYMTDASGNWTDQLIPDSVCGEPYDDLCVPPSLLAYDSVRDRVVLAEQYGGMRIGSKPASAAEFGPLSPMPEPDRRHLIAKSMTSSGGHVTLALRPLTHRQGAPSIEEPGPVYVMTDGRIEQLPEAGDDVPFFQVAAGSPDRVRLAWTRRSPSWDVSAQGVWTAERVRNRKTGRWALRSVRHRSVSRYDALLSLTVDARGRALAAYSR